MSKIIVSDEEPKAREKEWCCGKCGEKFEAYTLREGRSGSPVSEREELTCPNGHKGVRSYDSRGYLSQSMGISYPEGHELNLDS